MVKVKCKCNFGLGLIALILFAVGIYFLVSGFASQTSGASWWNVMLLYLIGLVLLGLGKGAKWSCCSECKVHMKK